MSQAARDRRRFKRNRGWAPSLWRLS
jgi:hypothetical protein